MIRVILFLFFIFLPLLFQIFFGRNYGKIKYWHICIISIVLWIIAYFINVNIFLYIHTASDIKDGLPFLGLMVIEIAIGVLIALTIILQIIVKFCKQKSLKKPKIENGNQ